MHTNRQKLARSKAFIAAVMLLASMSLQLFTAPPAHAAVDTIDDKVTQWLYYRGIWGCIGQMGNETNDDYTLSKEQVLNGQWIHDGSEQRAFGYLGPSLDGGDDGQVECKDGSAIDRATETYFGFTDEVDMICKLDDALDELGEGGAITPSIGDEDCTESDSFDIKDKDDGKFREAFTNILDESLADQGGRPRFDITDNPDSTAWYYWIGKRGIEIFCGNNTPISQGVDSSAGSSKDIVNVTHVDPSTGEIEDNINYYLANEDRDQDDTVDDVYYAKGSGLSGANRTCGQLAALTNDNAEAYKAYVVAHPDEDLPDDGAGSGTDDEDSAPVCSAGALGWVLCPLSEAMVAAIDGIASLLESLLVFQPLTNSDQGRAIRTIWGSLLVIANAGLIIAFLVVVFSQATSIGISNYGIKKLLPRVIAAAILMNLSFYICAAAVDISNIAGVSVKGIVDAGLSQIGSGTTLDGLEAGASIGQWVAVSGAALLAVAIAVGTGTIFLLIPVLISAVMAILTALLIIAARQVLITLLIIVAPLAILAWILPNTEQWFTKWRKLFTLLLLMFPMVMAIFYGAILVSSVTLAAGLSGDTTKDLTVQLLAFLVLIVPLFSLPFVMKSAGGVLDRLGVIVNNRNKGLVDRSRKKSQELMGRNSYQRGRAIRNQAKSEFRNKRFTDRLQRGYTPEGNLRDKLTRAQAGGVAEAGRVIGETKPAQAAKRAATRGVGGLYGISPTLGDLGSQALSGATNPSQLLPGHEMRGAQQHAIVRAAQSQEAKAFNERVASIMTTYERGGAAGADTSAGGHLEKQYAEAISTNNAEQAVAAINRLTNLGAGGRNRLSQVLQTHAVQNADMKNVVQKAIMQDNYGDLVKTRGDIAKSDGFGTDGKWITSGNLGKLGTAQLAVQDEKALYQDFASIPVSEATQIMSDPNLVSTIQNAKARAILALRASGATAVPTSGPIDPADPSSGDWSGLTS